MTRTVAIKKLKAILGPTAYYNVIDEITSPERRAAARVEWESAKAEYDQVSALAMARREIILKADPEYQALLEKMKVARKAKDAAGGQQCLYKFTVGTVTEVFGGMRWGHQRASGDTWEEVFAQLEQKAVAS